MRGKITGTARLTGSVLVITTSAKRGKKVIENKQLYLVEDSRPDVRVANPAYKLTKLAQAEDGTLAPTETEWHVHVDRHGPACSCPHATFRGANSFEPCKHTKALIAVGLMPGRRTIKE